MSAVLQHEVTNIGWPTESQSHLHSHRRVNLKAYLLLTVANLTQRTMPSLTVRLDELTLRETQLLMFASKSDRSHDIV